MRRKSLIWVGWIALFFLAAWLRLNNLESTPIHADEATGAKILSQRIEGTGYNFDPKHYHGPFPSLVAESIARLSGETSWVDLSLFTLRLGSVIAGLLTVMSPLLWAKTVGVVPALAAAACLASSPLLVYYNRIYIHESWLLLFGIITLAALHRLYARKNLPMAIISGISIGLLFAIKESFVLSILAWAGSATLLLVIHRPKLRLHRLRPQSLTLVFLLVLASFCTSSYLYSDGFRNLQGIIDSCKTYIDYETAPGHEKNFSYYLHFLLWPKKTVGTLWTEITVFALAAIGLWRTGKERKSGSIGIFLATATLLHWILYSCIAYKTPWLMLLPWGHVCLLAGLAFYNYQTLSLTQRRSLLLLFIGSIGWQIVQSREATGTYANDERNPYAYVATSRDARKIPEWIQQIQALPEASIRQNNRIAVIGKQYWPLPWFLRDFREVEYHPIPNKSLADYSIVFALPEQNTACDARLDKSHDKFLKSLRSNVPVSIYLQKDLAKAWYQTNPQ